MVLGLKMNRENLKVQCIFNEEDEFGWKKILHLFHFNGNNLTHCKQSMSEKYAVISHGLHVSFLSLFLSFGVFSLIFLD